MALPIHRQLFTDAGLNPGTSSAAQNGTFTFLTPSLHLQNGTFTFFCKTLAQTRDVNGEVVKKAKRTQEKDYKNNVPRQLFNTLTKPLFDMATRTTPGFPALPKFAIMHVHNRTNKELLNLLGLKVKFVPKKEYDENKTGVSAIITAPQVSPIPFSGEYTSDGSENARKFLFEKSLKHRGTAGSQFLDQVENWLLNNPQQSPLARYFPGQQARIQQQPPQPSVTQATAFNFSAPNPPANFGASQVNQPGPAATAHPASQQPPRLGGNQATSFNVAASNPAANAGVSQVGRRGLAAVTYPAQHIQLPQSAGSQAVGVNHMAPHPPVNFGAPQVSQSYLAAVNHPAPQVQLPQAVGGQVAAFPFPAPNTQANFGAFQANQPDPAATSYPAPQMQLQQPFWGQAATVTPAAPNASASFGASQVNQPGPAAMNLAHHFAQAGHGQAAPFNAVAPNAPVNFGVAQPDQAAMVYPAQQMAASQPGLDQGSSSSPMDTLSPMKSGYGADFRSMRPFSHVDGGVNGMDQAGPAPMEAQSTGMDQEPLDSAAPSAPIDPRLYVDDLATEVGEFNIPTDAEMDLFQSLPPEQRAQLHSVASSSNAQWGFDPSSLRELEKTIDANWNAPNGSSTEQGVTAPQPQRLQATEVAPREPSGLQELGSDQSFAQTSPFGVTETPVPALVDIGAEQAEFLSSSPFEFDNLLDYEAYAASS